MIREDEEVSQLAREYLQADGVQVLTGHKALRCERRGDAKSIVVEHQGQEVRIEFDALICAVGRVARLPCVLLYPLPRRVCFSIRSLSFGSQLTAHSVQRSTTTTRPRRARQRPPAHIARRATTT